MTNDVVTVQMCVIKELKRINFVYLLSLIGMWNIEGGYVVSEV